MNHFQKAVLGGMFGLVTGDALGVPVEFSWREDLERNPVAGMRAYGSHSQPAGTWSDDSSMALCLMDSLCGGFHPEDMMQRYAWWVNSGYMTAHGSTFDVGTTTRHAVLKYLDGTPALQCGGDSERDNGNGSLMRTLPLAFFLHRNLGPEFSRSPHAYELIHQASRLTHGHEISLMACGIYCAIACHLLNGRELLSAIENGIHDAKTHYAQQRTFNMYLDNFKRIDLSVLKTLDTDDIVTKGYVLYSLEAALWCLIHTSSLEDCLLKTVNLGRDTDSNAAIAGGLAGIYYGYTAIPKSWLDTIARKDLIHTVCSNFCRSLGADM